MTNALESQVEETDIFDLLVIGGGINGTGIARDAAGRGLRVALCEKGDLASATSQASSKLIHGGLRYLEGLHLRLVRESLLERERLLRNAAHLVWPMDFVLPHTKQQRPMWMIRTGLFLYDVLKGRSQLPRSRRLGNDDPMTAPLASTFHKGFVYPDCWVDDARLVVANARDAAMHGCRVWTRTECRGATRHNGTWHVELSGRGPAAVRARALINVAGPWASSLLGQLQPDAPKRGLRLVQGSHIVVPKLHDGEQAFLLQNDDGRVVFVLPFAEQFTLIGTTDVEVHGDPGAVQCSAEEAHYLCEVTSRFFERSVTPNDIVWSFAGVRPLVDDGSGDPSKVSRDYRFELDGNAAPLLNVFGGKLTAYRALAEKATEQLRPWFPDMGKSWTRDAPLPGSTRGPFEDYLRELLRRYPNMTAQWLRQVARRHGTDTELLLGDANSPNDLGTHFGAGLFEREVQWFLDREWAETIDDILWRRSKAGLRLDNAQREALGGWLTSRSGKSENTASTPHE